jgi:trk system potassium uptake protein TrkH
MNLRLTISALGALCALVGLWILTAVPWALYYGETLGKELLIITGIVVAVGGGIYYVFHDPQATYGAREGFAIVGLGWFLATFIGALPYVFTDILPSWPDALFESASGFTTTGASVIPEPSKVPKSILFWRSMTHWLGGMGIVVLSIAVLPFLGVGGMGMLKAEVPSPVVDKLRPRVTETARSLWKVYLILTVAEVILLCAFGMEPFDSICHSFGTVATGGFSTKDTSIEFYQNLYIHWTITVFMFAAGLNFTLHFQALSGNPRSYWKSLEFRVYLIIFLTASAFLTLRTYGTHFDSLVDAISHCAFQTSSIMTTTGFVTADWEKWSWDCQWILLCLMFLGGCAGSTGGGMKCLRLIVSTKHIFRELTLLIHPRAVIPLKVDQRVVPNATVNSIIAFLSLFMGFWALSTMLLVVMQVDLVTAIGATTATLSNVGPGLLHVGAMDNYAWFSWPCKLLLTLNMIVGRLELYTVFILLLPDVWRR